VIPAAPGRYPGIFIALAVLVVLACFAAPVAGAAIPQEESWLERFDLSGWVGGVLQLPDIDGGEGRPAGVVLLRPSLEYAWSERDAVQVTLALSAGEALTDDVAFRQAPWGADVGSAAADLNGSGRDVLLTASYRHVFDLDDYGELVVTAGLIDATEHLDENAFSNDELTQFMNAALVNGPNAFAPSYDLGVALDWECDDWHWSAVAMRVTKNEEGRTYGFLGMQVGRRIESAIGEGNYRLYLGGTTEDFEEPDEEGLARRGVALISADQRLGEVVGVWTRSGLQALDATMDTARTVSGGLNLNGRLWGREADEVGLGIAWLDGGNTSLRDSRVVELYASFGLADGLALTFDFQHLRDRYQPGAGEDLEGWVLGMRLGWLF
jgi:porin